MPKTVYQIVLGVLLLTITATACKDKAKEKPVDENNLPKTETSVTTGNDTTAKDKPVDQNNLPKPQ